ncbi:MAG: hypothetical protein ACKOA8_07245 [Deltaproteobacteria bacterium]
MKVAIWMGLVMTSLSFGLDFAKPVVSCSKGNYLVQVGKQGDDSRFFGRLYVFKKITHPGYGTVSYPEPVTDLIPVKSVDEFSFRGKSFDLSVWDGTQDMPTGDPEIDGKCEICGIFKGSEGAAKYEIKGLECRLSGD